MSLRPNTATVTIASGASLSTGALLGDGILCGILMPAAWTSADLSFQVSDDGVTWYDLYSDAMTEISLTLAGTSPQGHRMAVSPDSFASCIWIKVRSGLTGAAVNQAAARTITLISRKFNPVR